MNMRIYNAVREVPEKAQRPITSGRLKGKTDINPMWRIQALTEQFGPCGVGWKPIITNKQMIPGAKGEIVAVVDVDLFVKIDGAWSEPIPGTGGSSFVANEKNGPYTSDEAYKMAYTDALSVCCKLLGMGADVYWEAGSKYTTGGPICEKCHEPIIPVDFNNGEHWEVDDVIKFSKENLRGKCYCYACLDKAMRGIK